jgi:uncharacterized protein (TIGR00266 family)
MATTKKNSIKSMNGRIYKRTRKSNSRKSFKDQATALLINEIPSSVLENTTSNSIKVSANLDSFDPNISISNPGDGKLIPKFHIINSPAFASLVISLKQGQSVYCNYGSLNYMDGTVDVSTKTTGILKGLIRTLFTTTSMFLTFYTGVQNKDSIVSFSSFMPGDIIALRIKKDEKYVMSSFGFLAASANVKVGTTTRLRNFIGGDSIFINEVSTDNTTNDDGIVWISSYGGFDKITIKEGESVKVDRDMFAFAKKEYKYKLTTIGNVKSFFFSGEAFMMRFTGPCEIYVHSNNVNKFIEYISKRISYLNYNNALKHSSGDVDVNIL